MKTTYITKLLAIIATTALAGLSMAAITATSDDFSSDTSGSWISVGALTTAIVYDGTTAGDYDDGDLANKLAYTSGMTLTGDGISDLDGSGDGGLQLNTQDAVQANEAMALTIAGTMEEGRVLNFSGNVYNDDGSFSIYKAQLWNTTDDILLAESSATSVNGLSHVAYVPVDFSISYEVTADDDGDTLQIRFVEDNNSASRNVYVDNFTVTSTPATLYAYEDFYGIIDDRVDLTGATGSGFTVTNTNFRMQYKTGLGYTDSQGNILQTRGNSAGMTNIVSGTQNLQLAFNSLNSGVVYASYLLELQAGVSFGLMTGLQTAPVENAATPTASIAAGFRSTSSNFGAYSDTGGIDLRTGPDSSPYAISNVLVVIKVNLDIDELTLWLNPSNLTDVAGSAANTITGTGSGIGSLSSVLFSLGGLEQATIDEVRIGNSLDVVVPVVDPSVEILLWNFNGDSGELTNDVARWDYTSRQVYVGGEAVANTLAFNGRSSGSDYHIVDKGAGHEKALIARTINTASEDFGVYLQKLDFRVDNMNITNKTLVSWSFDILGTDEPDLIPTNWTVKINSGNYSTNLYVSDGWYDTNNSVVAQTFDFVDDDTTWTTITGSYEIAVNQAGSAGGIQISTDTGGYVSGTPSEGIVLDNIQITIASIVPVYDSALEEWAAGFGLYGVDAAATANPDGDIFNNLYEYGLGGDPSSATNNGYSAEYALAAEGGTNWLYFVHPKRSDAVAAGLVYTVETDTDLVAAPGWTNANYEVLGTATDGFATGFDAITNRISTEVETQQFIRLKIEEL